VAKTQPNQVVLQQAKGKPPKGTPSKGKGK
jgi:hypothetical protein